MVKNLENFDLEFEKQKVNLSDKEKEFAEGEALKKREGVFAEKKDKENDYSKRGLKDLDVTEPIIMPSDDVFNEAERIKVGDIKAGNAFNVSADCKTNNIEVRNSAFYFAYHCQVKNISGVKLFENAAGSCLITGDIKATTNFSKADSGNILNASIGEKSKGVVILGENIGEDVIYPSVIQMKDRVADDPVKMEEFFKNEFDKDQKNDEENIFDHLKWFNWEGKTLEEGKEKLKKRYSKFKETLFESYVEFVREKGKGRGEEERSKESYRQTFPQFFYNHLQRLGIDESYFYYLINDNSKRQEIFQGFEKLRKVEKNSLVELNDYISKLKCVRSNLSLLSMSDWIRLSEYAEFLDFDEKEIKEIENKANDELINDEISRVKLSDIIENPDGYKGWRTAKFIKQFSYQNKRFNTGELSKEFEKEKNNKIDTKIKAKINAYLKDYILKSPENNLNKYLKEIGFENETKKGIIFAARLHKVLENKKEENNKSILLELMKGKKPIEFDANKIWLEEKTLKKQDQRLWLSKTSGKIDTEKWLAHKNKEYSVATSNDFFLSQEKAQKDQLDEINKHFEEIGLQVAAGKIEEIEKIFSRIGKEISVDIKKDIKNHIQAYKSLSGIERSKFPKKIILETEEDPLEVIQMGEKVVGSCLKIRGGHEESVVCNAADINKKIIWAKNEKEEVVGRMLIGITREGELASFRVFNNDPRIDLDKCYKDFVYELAEDIKTEITDRGKIEQLVGENWYDDGMVDLEK